ncbi:MAG TPA: class I SAM-dependent RNA methyltransferase [Pyrinomonadaceae bacterium]
MNGNESVTLEVEIERVLPGGLGLAHAEGRTIFVSLAAPGDVVKIKIDRLRGKTAFASIVEILTASPVRIEPPCPYFGRCGGCDFQHLPYNSQLEFKREIIRDCLYRIARIENLPHIEVIASPKQWQYRARANWQVDPNGRRIGYFERGTHQICDIADCAVLIPELQESLKKVRSLLPDQIPGNLHEIEAVAGDDGLSLAPALAGYDSQDVTRRIAGEDYRFSANSFFQINHELLEQLSDVAVAEANGEAAVDLYCGVGLFTIPLARRVGQVTAVEGNGAAAKYARRNVSSAGLQNVSVLTSRVSRWLLQAAAKGTRTDFVLLDPPRTGAEEGVVEGIVALQPKSISYVSCDPATLARDLKRFLSSGYSLTSILAFDLFPQTHHVETVVQLSAS